MDTLGSPCKQLDAQGFKVSTFTDNERLQVITLSHDLVQKFRQECLQWPVQALEYKPFLRFVLAERLDALSNYGLRLTLRGILGRREQGAFLLQVEESPLESFEGQTEFYIQLSTAISHLIGMPNFDAMYGKYYARFTVKNSDDSDSYLCQAHRP
ncbi:carbon starvation induced protein CsiD [Dongshaea marina]|uniref:carbon starvation induced protein CsiD n=1 Tax=Dongshaea marina TaxID=2047966 RepID=UPI00227754C3|nr:carbon starvation induced protein CsiD [Dongshaea marina]